MSLRSPRLWLGLALGIAAGLLYGWVLQPVELYDTAPSSLREDYRTDYVLMVAEAYGVEADRTQAVVRLAALGPQPPIEFVESAIAYATANGFAAQDIERLSRLARGLGTAPPAAGIQPP
ncbi:MAG TPA: hypothetical protein VFI11_06095 [Anaerolineales bacterium]|nr:hypothetical protein [Anaerolineales bacterium]